MPKPYKKKEQEIVEEDKRYGAPKSTSPKTSALMRDDSQNYDGSNFVVPAVLDPTSPDWRNPTPEVDTSRDVSWNTWLSDMRDEDDGNPDQDLEGLPQAGGWSGATFPYTVPASKGDNGKAPTIDFSSSPYWLSEMSAIYGDLGNDKFKFDLNGEELYQQYRDQYLRNGRLAMMDTMGQAAGLTGGYGSSYAQQVGQQTYQGYVNELNNIVPDVYSAAYQRWRDEQGDKLDRYKVASSMYGITSDAENAEANRKASLEKAEIEAETQRAKDEYQYRIDAAKLDQSRVESMLKSGDWAYDSNGDLVYTGYYTRKEDGSTYNARIEDPIVDYLDYITPDEITAKRNFGALMQEAQITNRTLEQVIVDMMASKYGWTDRDKQTAIPIMKTYLEAAGLY